MQVVTIVAFDMTLGNGTERAVANFANGLCRLGRYAVHVVSCLSPQGATPYFALDAGVTLHNLGRSVARKTGYAGIVRDIAACAKKTGAAFVLGTTHALNSILVAVRVPGIRRIACEHMNYDAAPVVSRAIWRCAYPLLDAVVLLTQSDRAHYAFHKRAVVIPNSVPAQSRCSSCENHVMLAVGRLTFQKGFDMLVQAFAAVHGQCPDWRLRIVGDGEDRAGLERQVQQCALGQCVDVVPFTSDIAAEYLGAGMYVMSSRFEGLPMVLLEAKSFGLPIISFDCPEGPADVVRDGVDGFLVPAGNVAALSQRMLCLASDDARRKVFGLAAKEDGVRFCPDAVMQKWDAFFREL